MQRVSIKIVGASGQGLISIGEILAKAFKRSGYCVFGYREYMSLIKGGHGCYQLDICDEHIESTEESVNLLISLNHHGFEHNLNDVKEGGVIIHDTADWVMNGSDEKMLRDRNITVICLPTAEILKRLNAKPILANVLFSAFVWAAFKGDKKLLKLLVGEKFAKKKDLLEQNMQVIEEGFAYHKEHVSRLSFALPAPNAVYKKQLLLTGSQAMGLGLVASGVRLYAGYPMTPSSPLLSYVAEIQNETGMAVKQAEDEITAAQMMSGAMFAGTRAVTATSGGGFDLMTETVSLNGIIENPTVFILAQRPGPATGLPTWTAQGDLHLAVHGGHGEFARCVLSVSDAADSFRLMNEAFNIAEQYQTPVIVLADKQIAEAIYTQPKYETKKLKIDRGNLVQSTLLLKTIKSADRYDPSAKDGISKRWLPGSKAHTYCAQGDEHNGDGSVDESAENAIAQMEKRMRKQDAMKRALPEPELYRIENGKLKMENSTKDLDLLLVSWGSNKGVILDVLKDAALKGKKIGYLHYTYLWPLKTELFAKLSAKAKKTVFIEGNYTGQLQRLIGEVHGKVAAGSVRKYDGRPFFYNELLAMISSHL